MLTSNPLISALLFLPLLSGCGILFGKVKPVSEKSIRYEVMDLEREANWEKLPPEALQNTPENPSGARDESSESDVSYQSKDSPSIISLNTACRPSIVWDKGIAPEKRDEEEKKQLQAFTGNLLLGIDVSKGSREEKFVTVSEQTALETTLAGELVGQKTRIRTLVVRKNECIYDVMFVTTPKHFEEDVGIFTRFVASLKLHR